jgi:hypothetical protein
LIVASALISLNISEQVFAKSTWSLTINSSLA